MGRSHLQVEHGRRCGSRRIKKTEDRTLRGEDRAGQCQVDGVIETEDDVGREHLQSRPLNVTVADWGCGAALATSEVADELGGNRAEANPDLRIGRAEPGRAPVEQVEVRPRPAQRLAQRVHAHGHIEDRLGGRRAGQIRVDVVSGGHAERERNAIWCGVTDALRRCLPSLTEIEGRNHHRRDACCHGRRGRRPTVDQHGFHASVRCRQARHKRTRRRPSCQRTPACARRRTNGRSVGLGLCWRRNTLRCGVCRDQGNLRENDDD